jgi:hypothetical protein
MEITRVKVELGSLSDIMFDKFIDYSTERRPPDQKLYLDESNGLVLPQDNIIAFLFGEFPAGCAKTFEGKKGKQYIQIGQSHVFIDQSVVPFSRGGKSIAFKGFNDNLWVHQGSPRMKKGSLSIKSEMKERPVLKHPWNLAFSISIVKNNFIDETKLYNWFMIGGMQIALGTYRPRWGRFTVNKWELLKQ